jgi:hypothetical protein
VPELLISSRISLIVSTSLSGLVVQCDQSYSPQIGFRYIVREEPVFAAVPSSPRRPETGW